MLQPDTVSFLHRLMTLVLHRLMIIKGPIHSYQSDWTLLIKLIKRCAQATNAIA